MGFISLFGKILDRGVILPPPNKLTSIKKPNNNGVKDTVKRREGPGKSKI